jgi:hypothetical protein
VDQPVCGPANQANVTFKVPFAGKTINTTDIALAGLDACVISGYEAPDVDGGMPKALVECHNLNVSATNVTFSISKQCECAPRGPDFWVGPAARLLLRSCGRDSAAGLGRRVGRPQGRSKAAKPPQRRPGPNPFPQPPVLSKPLTPLPKPAP